MRFNPITFLFGAVPLALCSSVMCPSVAQAQSTASVTNTGTSLAEVIEPSRLMKLADLRFGAFVRPSVASRLTIATNGTATGTNDIATSMNIAQPSTGRGQAIFRIDGTPNRFVIVHIPNNLTISNGSATMQVSNFTSNLPGNQTPRLDTSGVFVLNLGGRLNVNANQAPGNYTGTLTITVLFL